MSDAFAAADVPGKLCAGDRALVAAGFNALRNPNNNSAEATPLASGLRITDTLDSRFMFTVSNPRNLNLAQLRALALKLGSLRRMVLDLPRNCARVECWRAAHTPAGGGGARKRKRGVVPATALPPYLAEPLREAAADADYDALQGVLLWVLNRDEEFCTFDFAVEHDAASNTYTLSLQNFDAVTHAFVAALHTQWQGLVRDVVLDWSSQTLVVCVRI
jgi:hypothetical protein